MSSFHILSLSGGGFKGLFTAQVLAEIENKFGCPVAKKFDLLAGTSIGGILSIALALEIPACELLSLFVKNGDRIFKKRATFGIRHSKYSGSGLKDVLTELFEDKKVKDLKHNLIIPAINLTKGGPQVFKTSHHPNLFSDKELKLVDIGLATSAAPTYFPIHGTGIGDFVDGGLVANHPGLFACIEAQQFFNINQNDIKQLHIGTLSNKCTSSGKKSFLKSGVLQWGLKLVELTFSCQEQSVHQILKFLLKDNYYSIDEQISDIQTKSIGLDKINETAQKILIQIAGIASQRFLTDEHFKCYIDHNKIYKGAHIEESV
jgi:patatin-like phospholipase/acyl hydrolase